MKSFNQPKPRRSVRQILRETIDGAFVALSACFLLFVYAPVELFLTNQSSFWFTLYTMLPVVLATFLIFSAVSFVGLFLCNLVSKHLYYLATAVCSTVLICSYVQGNFLISGLPQLDGLAIDWNRYQGQRIQSILLWIIVTVIMSGLIIALKPPRFMKGAKIISIYMLLLFTVTLTALAFSSDDSLDKSILTATTENMFKMSDDTNFVILMLDAVGSDIMMDMVENKEIEDYEETFQDFTCFTNTVGAYSCTKHAVPYILSGFWYENSCTYNDYMSRVFSDSPLLSELEERSYQMGIYDEDLHPSAENNTERFDNMEPIHAEVTSYFSFAKLLIKLGGIKFAPYDLKQYCYAIAYNFGKVRQLPQEYNFPVFEDDNDAFFQAMQNTDITVTSDKCFRYIHVEGAHAPFRYDKDMNIVEESDYRSCIAASITLARVYLEKLKAAGIYDNSVIIIMADHGFNQELSDQGLTFVGRQNPILFIKGTGEKHELQTSDIPLAFGDLQTAYARLLDGAPAARAFDWQTGDYRERRYLYYDLNDGVGENHMVEYIQTGEARDLNTLVPTGNEYYYNLLIR